MKVQIDKNPKLKGCSELLNEMVDFQKPLKDKGEFKFGK